MKRLFAVIGVLTLSGLAQAGEPEPALTEVLERLDEAEEAASAVPTCELLVGVEIRKLQADVKRARKKPTATARKGLRKTLTGIIAKTYSSPCPGDVKELLLAARAPLDGQAEKRAPAAAGACWSKKDPGCNKRRDGQGPMDKAAFEALLANLAAARANEAAMLQVLEQELRVQGRAVTCRQLAKLVGRLSSAAAQMNVVEMAAPRIVDPEDAAVVASTFKPNAALVQHARERIQGSATGAPEHVPAGFEVPAAPGPGDFGDVPEPPGF